MLPPNPPVFEGGTEGLVPEGCSGSSPDMNSAWGALQLRLSRCGRIVAPCPFFSVLACPARRHWPPSRAHCRPKPEAGPLGGNGMQTRV